MENGQPLTSEIQGNERIAFDGKKVEVDTGSNTLDFIITGVNHKLSGNEWVTNLDTIATTKSKFAK